MNKRELLIKFYKEAFEMYGEALQMAAQDGWDEEFEEDSWEEFHDLDKKLKVKFYYEDEQ